MTYPRPIVLRCYRPGLVGTLGYALYAADGTTVLAARTTSGVVEQGVGEYVATPLFDPAWGRFVRVRWTGGGVDATEGVDQATTAADVWAYATRTLAGQATPLPATLYVGGVPATPLDAASFATAPANFGTLSIAAGQAVGTSTLAAGAAMDLVPAPNATAVAAIQSGLATTAGQTSLLAAVQSLNNLSALANLFGPTVLDVPDSGTAAFAYTLVVRDGEGHLADLAATPTVTAANATGTDRSGNLSSVAHPGVGQYTFSYSVASTATREGLILKATGTAAGDATARLAMLGLTVTDVDQSTAIAAIKGKTDLLTIVDNRVSADVTAIAGYPTSVNTGTQNTIGFVSGAYVMASGGTVQADVTYVGGEPVRTDYDGRLFVNVDRIDGRDPKTWFADEVPLVSVYGNQAGDPLPTATQIDTALSTTHGAGAWGGGGGGVVAGPAFASLPRGVDARVGWRIDVAQGAAARLPIDVFDAFGAALPLAGRTLRFVIFDANRLVVARVQGGGRVTVDGAVPNRCYVDVLPADVPQDGSFLWVLWDVTDAAKPFDLGRGPVRVQPAIVGT